MKIILLCAGMGTRLGNLTDNNPKCLMPFKNTTLLEYSIFLKAAIGSEGRINTGCTSLFIAIHELHKHLHARMPNITGKSSAAPAIRRND